LDRFVIGSVVVHRLKVSKIALTQSIECVHIRNNRHAFEGVGAAIVPSAPGCEDHRMRKVLRGLAGLIVAVLGALGAMLAFDAPVKAPLLASISEPFADIDFSDLPTVQNYAARDGAKLGYRVYEGGGTQVVVLIHGSSGDGAGMHRSHLALNEASGFKFGAAFSSTANAETAAPMTSAPTPASTTPGIRPDDVRLRRFARATPSTILKRRSSSNGAIIDLDRCNFGRGLRALGTGGLLSLATLAIFKVYPEEGERRRTFGITRAAGRRSQFPSQCAVVTTA
jgi:hypothetical protein